ncbi:MAG: citrate synthase, partial [Austwickia sp.]|nr:citrate synthase [Austwickia sp.]
LRLGAPLCDVALATERAALDALAERRPDRPLGVNMEYWAAVLLHGARVPPRLFTPLFVCARAAGWSAHILEQKAQGRPIRPVARYVGETTRALEAVPGWADIPPAHRLAG